MFILTAVEFGTTIAALEAANLEVSREDLQVSEVIIVPGSFGGSGNATTVDNQAVGLIGTGSRLKRAVQGKISGVSQSLCAYYIIIPLILYHGLKYMCGRRVYHSSTYQPSYP